MAKSAKQNQHGVGNPLVPLQPWYIEYHQYVAHIVLGVDRPSVAELYAPENAIRDLLPSLSDRCGYEVQITPQGYLIKLTISNENFTAGFNALTQQKLNDLVQPKYRARGAAVANVKRVQGHHKGTVVTITVTQGRARPLTLDQIMTIPGVLRADHDSDDNLMFSPHEPNEVRTITAAVTDALGLYCPPVTVLDDDPKLALLPAFDYPGETPH
jgi:hypothetical protein